VWKNRGKGKTVLLLEKERAFHPLEERKEISISIVERVLEGKPAPESPSSFE